MSVPVDRIYHMGIVVGAVNAALSCRAMGCELEFHGRVNVVSRGVENDQCAEWHSKNCVSRTVTS